MDIVLGPPGTGKTTFLLKLVEEALARGVRPDEIGYFGFTRRSADEAKHRAIALTGYTEDDLPYFRTLHSMAFRELGMNKSQVMQRQHYKELSDSLGLPFNGYLSNIDPDIIVTAAEGDRILFMINRARVMMRSLRELYDDDADNLSFERVDWVQRALEEYKEARSLRDFNDMIAMYLQEGTAPDLKLLVVDEAQDLSRLQWRMVEHLSARASSVYVAGDDDQAIFRWAGADVDHFLSLKGRRMVLGQSYRVPAEVQRLAFRIISGVERRHAKEWSPRPDDGLVREIDSLEEVELGTGTHLILTRNSFILNGVEQELRREGYLYQRQGVPSVNPEFVQTAQDWEDMRTKGQRLTQKQVLRCYALIKQIDPKHRALAGTSEHDTFNIHELQRKHGLRTRAVWHEAFDRLPAEERSYLVAARRRGDKFRLKPRITLSTIHGSKGGEADEVTVFTDMAKRTHLEFYANPDDELRVFYVACTRARLRLNIVRPRTKHHFALVV